MSDQTLNGRQPFELRPQRTHREVAALMGVTYQRVQVLEARGLRKLRGLLEDAGLSFDDLAGAEAPRVQVREGAVR